MSAKPSQPWRQMIEQHWVDALDDWPWIRPHSWDAHAFVEADAETTERVKANCRATAQRIRAGLKLNYEGLWNALPKEARDGLDYFYEVREWQNKSCRLTDVNSPAELKLEGKLDGSETVMIAHARLIGIEPPPIGSEAEREGVAVLRQFIGSNVRMIFEPDDRFRTGGTHGIYWFVHLVQDDVLLAEEVLRVGGGRYRAESVETMFSVRLLRAESDARAAGCGVWREAVA